MKLRYLPTQETLDAWATLSGDHNPLHVSPDYAEQTKFGGTIAHGHLTLAYMERAMVEQLGERWMHGGSLEDVRFTAPVRPGGEYLLVVEPADEFGEATWSVEVRSLADGKTCAQGIARLPDGT